MADACALKRRMQCERRPFPCLRILRDLSGATQRLPEGPRRILRLVCLDPETCLI